MALTLRIWILIFFIIAAAIAINPLGYFEKGVIIKSITQNSSAALAGITRGEIIQSINSLDIKDIVDYSSIIEKAFSALVETNFTMITDKGTFNFNSKAFGFDVNDNLTIIAVSSDAEKAGLVINSTIFRINSYNISNKDDFIYAKDKLESKIKLDIKTNKRDYVLRLNSALEITVGEIPKTNIKAGLDLAGGSRALVMPEKKLSEKEMADLIAVSSERMNVYGISDVVIKAASDLSGNDYMVVEIAGITPSELQELIGKQGKFEAKIGNETIFLGGKQDITSVCRNDPSCAAVRECVPSGQGYWCSFDFAIYLSEDAAKRQANITDTLSINLSSGGEKILSKNLDLYLDDKPVDSLQIDADLKGKVATQISIRGPGTGATQQEAYEAAQANMIKLQTVLITGSLPFKLSIVKLDSISPLLGKEFIKNIFVVIVLSVIIVAVIIFIRYKKIVYALPIIFTMLIELFLILGAAALIRWNLDLASIAGIIAAIGTGVDDQIVIIDESRLSRQYSWKERFKRAFAIILGSFSTLAVAMLPLWWAGAGMLKGFALTTIIGICIGVFITRPAYSDIISKIVKE